MNVKKMYAYVLVFLLSLFVLTGCGSDNGGGEFKYVAPVDNGTDGNRTNGEKTTISGYVVDEAIENAKVSLFSIDGTLLDENITTNKEGYFEAKLDDLPNEYIIYSKGGEVNGETFDGELFAYCNSKSCNLTPLSTITYQYSNLLVEGTFQERYAKAKSIIMEYTGISSDDIHKISGVSNFKFDKFRTLVKSEGFSSVTSGIANDLVDDYIDENKYQVLFTAIKARVATPISVTVEPIIDKESNSSLSLTVSGIDGSQESKGYMSDIVATTKQTIMNDDLEEVTEDVPVYYSFNVGEYKNKLNTETTVLSNLFINDIELIFLPSESKIKLIELLKEKYSLDYENAINDYKKVIEVSKAYSSIYQKSLLKLVGDARLILSSNSFSRIQPLQKKKIFSNVSERNINNLFKKTKVATRNIQKLFKVIKYQSSKYVNVTYDTNSSTNEYNFKVSNSLPVYFGLKKSLKDYSPLDNLTLPLIQPSKLGLFGMLSIDWKSFNSLLKTTTGIKNAPSTTISGNNWDSDLFKDSVSKPTPNMRRDYTFTKEAGVNLPTIMNVVTGASSVVKIAYGASISTKFEKTMFNLSKKANDVSKGLKYAQDTLDLIVSGSDFFVSFLDTMEKDTSNPYTKFKNFRADLKTINNYALASQNLLKGITSLIPPKNEDMVIKRGNKFLTTLGTGKDKVAKSHFVSQRILNNAKDKKITYKEAMADIVTGMAFNHILKTIKLPKDDNSQYKKAKKEFEEKYFPYFEFTNLFVYSFRSKKQAKYIYNLYPGVKPSFENALKEYTKTLVPITFQLLDIKKGIPNLYQATLSRAVEKINLFKLLKKANGSLSDGNALKYAAKLIIEMSKMVKDNAIKNIQGMVKNIVVQIPQYLIGTKYIQLASSANDLIGLGVAWGCTPNSIPIGISVDNNGELTFKEPEIKVLGAVNKIVPLSGQEDVIMTLGNNRNPLIIANKEEPPVYNLAYTIVFGNEFDNLKNFIYDAKEWKDDKAIDVSMWIKKYPNDNLDTEPVFLKNVDYANWTITPKEVVANLEKNTINGKSIPTLNVTNVFAGQKRQSPFPSFSFGKSPFAIQLPSVERGIFVENFDYKIYEFTDSPLKESSTYVKPLDRIIFKTLNAKELKEKVYLYKYKALKNTLAITNNNDFSIMVYCPSTGEEWEINDGQTRLFDNEKYKDAEFIISDIVISKYGKAHGYETMAQILGAFEKNLHLSDYIINSKFTVAAKEASNAKKYQFLIKADTSSDFVDKQPALDLSQVVRNNELEDLFYDYTGTKAFLSSYIDSQDYIVGQYSVESYRKDGEAGEDSINFRLESGALIPPSIPKDVVDPNVIKNAHESELINNYKLKDIKDYKLDTKVDTYNRVSEFKLTNKAGNSIVFNIDGYQDSEEKTTLYLTISSGIKNLIECTTAPCIADDDLEKFNFRLILVSPQKLFPDSDSDNIIDSVDMFPNNSEYQFDSDRDGMPDAWETEYGLNPNDPSDAIKDLNHNGENNLQEFTNGTNPKNTPPKANAGADQTIKKGETVTLDANGSTDDNKDSLTYKWTWKSDVDDSTLEKDDESFKVAGLSAGEHTFTLTVTDSDGEVDSDEVVVTVVDSEAVNLSDGLVAHYEFEGNANDSSGNGNDGTEYGGVSYVDGVIGQAASFDGVDDYILVNNSSTFPSKAITISYWINRDDLPSNLDNYISKELAFQSYLRSDGQFESGLWKGNAGQWSGYLEDSNISDNLNQWLLYTITFDNVSKKAQSFINGKLMDETVETDINAYLRTSSNPMYIGRNGSQSLYYINSKLDDLLIYNRALNESEIQELYKLGQPKEEVDKPTNVTATATTNAITLKWDEVTNASIYKVCMSETTISDASKCEENGGTLLSGGTSTETTITDNLNADTTYYFRVQGFRSGYDALWSDERSIKLAELVEESLTLSINSTDISAGTAYVNIASTIVDSGSISFYDNGEVRNLDDGTVQNGNVTLSAGKHIIQVCSTSDQGTKCSEQEIIIVAETVDLELYSKLPLEGSSNAITNDGTNIIYGTTSGKLYSLNINTQESSFLSDLNRRVSGLFYDITTSRYYYSSISSGQVYVVSIDDNIHNSIYDLSFPDGLDYYKSNLYVVTNDRSGILTILNNEGEYQGTLNTGIDDIVGISHTDKFLYILSEDGHIYQTNSITGQSIKIFSNKSLFEQGNNNAGLEGITVLNNRIYVSYVNDSSIYLIDVNLTDYE